MKNKAKTGDVQFANRMSPCCQIEHGGRHLECSGCARILCRFSLPPSLYRESFDKIPVNCNKIDITLYILHYITLDVILLILQFTAKY